MDGMNSNFGNLSLGAAEWKPHSQPKMRGFNTNLSSETNSDLNAGQVKEFIPGQGWTVSPSDDADNQVAASNTNETHSGR